MYELKIKTEFSSAHNLRGYEGACESLHGHNWHVEVYVRSSKLNDIGLALDFKELKKHTNEIMDELDHRYLNELDAFKEVNPSSENLAKYIFEELERKIGTGDVAVSKITVYESKNSAASYYKEG